MTGVSPRRIDCHVHAFPDRLALAVREALNRQGRLRSSPLLPDVAQSVLDQGFDGAWILPYAHRAGVSASVNEWSAEQVGHYPWLVAGATFHPDDENFTAVVEAALVRLGLRVVKLHCSVGNFSVADPRLEPLWHEAERLGVPVVVHAGRGPGQTDAAELDGLIPVLKSHNDLKFVLAHSGHPGCGRALELMDDYPNLYGDLTPVWENTVALTAEHLERFSGRFLFGSDAPNNPVLAREQASRFDALGLNADTLSMLMGGTAERLLRAASLAG
ncbi:MAG TPA: amidohydrolase family protein [Dehalococcoidia bacterium]